MFKRVHYFTTKDKKVGVEVKVFEDGSVMVIYEWFTAIGFIDRAHWSVHKGISDLDFVEEFLCKLKACKDKSVHALM